jgi:hypothetical protein
MIRHNRQATSEFSLGVLKTRSIAIALLMLVSPAFTRIGETEQQVEARHGKATRTLSKGNEPLQKLYRSSGLDIGVTYIVMTWVFNSTKGSLFIAVLVHTSFDMVLATLNRLFPVPIVSDYGSNVPVLIGLGGLALVLVALTRGRLGYQHYRQEEPDLATASR